MFDKVLDKTKIWIREQLNARNVDSIEELKHKTFSKVRKLNTPDEYVKELLAKRALSPRQFEFQEMLDRCRVSDILPVEWFDEEIGIYQTEDAHGFVFDCGPIVGYKDGLDEQLRGLFNLSLEPGTCMQTLLIASSELEPQFKRYLALHKEPLMKKIAEHRIDYYKQGLKGSLRDGYKMPVRDFRLVISFTFDGTFDEANRKQVITLRQSIEAVLKNSFIANRIMYPKQLLNLYRQLWCCSSELTEEVEYNPNLPIRDQISVIDNNIYQSPDGMVINDIGVRSLAVSGYPEEFKLSQCHSFIGNQLSISEQISYPFVICQNVVFLDSSKENAKLNASALKTAEQVKPGKFTAYFQVFHKKHHEYQMLQSMANSGEGMIYMGHSIHIYYPLGEAETAYQEVKSLYKTFNWTLTPNSNLQLPSYFTATPLMHNFASSIEQKDLRMIQQYTQTNAVNTMPLFAENKGTGNPIIQVIGTCGQIMSFDLFQSINNYNVALSASSGAGKSFFMNEIVKSYKATGARISVIDVGRSYKDSCAVLNGQYIEFTQEANICVNPFSFIKFKIGLDANSKLNAADIEQLEDLDFASLGDTMTKEALLNMEDLDDQIVMLKQIFLVSAGFGDDHPKQQLADSYFEQAILSSLQKYQTKSTYTTVYNELIARYELEKDVFAKEIADSIKSYTREGIFGKFFEGESNLDLDNSYIVLELEELQGKGQLKFIVLLILMLKITQDMYLSSREQRKLCIIDEAWDLMAGGNTGKFIVTAYRRARKYNGSIQTITQRIDDYEMSDTTRACYENAGIKIMLMQSPPEKIKVDDYTVMLIKSLKSEPGIYSELIIDMNKSLTKCRFIVDGFTQMLYSTNPTDITLLNLVKKHDDLDTADALERLMALRNTFTSKYRRPREVATQDLINMINEYGYSTMLRELNFEPIEKGA